MEYDYVVVGAGSAGCVIAARLAESGATVALLEAGGSDHHPLIHIPAGVGNLVYNPRVNWMYTTEPEPGTSGRRLHTPRGKVLGGSSSINGMLYVRGHRQDFDDWASSGCTGWSYDDVLPMFKKSEHYASGGDPRYRGQGGPLRVEDYRTILPLTHLFVKAAQEAGHRFTPDMNGELQEGVGYSQMTRLGRVRGSTYRAFLTRSDHRNNVDVRTHTLVSALMLEGRRCVGVRFVRGGESGELRARREVIVSAGAINSPQILQLSGIGDPEHLRQLGVETVLAAPQVGRNLSDHYTSRVSYRLKGIRSINELASGWRLVPEVLKFVFSGRGALTFGVTSSSVFCRSTKDIPYPDLQLLFTPASYVFGKALVLDNQPGMTVAVCPTRPRSRGSVLASSKDPRVAPHIRLGALTDRADVDVMLSGLRQTRDILNQPSLKPYLVNEIAPGANVTGPEELEQFMRDQGGTIYHPIGTCAMGQGAAAVVDPTLKVRGIAGLRVADASIMPSLPTGNTNAATIMIGEMTAAMVLQEARSALPFAVPPGLQPIT